MRLITSQDETYPFHPFNAQSPEVCKLPYNDVLVFNELCERCRAPQLFLKSLTFSHPRWLSFVCYTLTPLPLSFIYPLISLFPPQLSLPAYHSLLCLIAFQFALRDAWVVQSSPPVSLKSICTLPWPGQFHGLPCRKYQMTSLSSENEVSWGIESVERLIPPPNPSYPSSPPAQTSCSQVENKVRIINCVTPSTQPKVCGL